MSLSLFKENMRSGWKLVFLFAAILTLYVVLITTMYDPVMSASLAALVEAMPQIMNAVGLAAETTSLNSFLASYLYGFLLILLPMILAVLLANRLMARHVDRGTMAWLLASPNARGKVVLTQAVTLIGTMLVLTVYVTALAVGVSAAVFPGELNVAAYLRLNIGLFGLLLTISGICFLASCIFCESKHAVGVGVGIPLVFYFLQMMVNLGGKLDVCRYFTVFTFFDANGLMAATGSALAGAGVLAALGVGLYVAGILIFRKRNLPL